MNTQQLKSSLKWLEDKASEAYYWSHLLLALGSTYFIFNWIIQKGVSLGYNIVLVSAVAYGISFAWYKAVEHTLKIVLPFAWAYVLTDKDTAKGYSDNEKRAGKSSIWISVILVLATASLSVFVNGDIARDITEERDTSKEKELIESTTLSYDKDVEALERRLNKAEKADAAKIAAAQKEADELLLSAKKSKGPEMFRLYQSGNGWAADQLAPAIKRAERRGQYLLKKAKSSPTAPGVEKQLLAYIDKSSVSRDTTTAKLSSIVEFGLIDHANRVRSRNWILTAGVIFLLLVNIVACRLKVITAIENGTEIVDDNSPGIGKVVAKVVREKNKELAKRIADRMKITMTPTLATATVQQSVSSPVQTVETPPTVERDDTPETVVVQRFQPVAETFDDIADSELVNLSPEDIKKCRDRCWANYKRQFTHATEDGRDRCAARYRKEAKTLTHLGYKIRKGETVQVTVKRGGKIRTISFPKLEIINP